MNFENSFAAFHKKYLKNVNYFPVSTISDSYSYILKCHLNACLINFKLLTSCRPPSIHLSAFRLDVFETLSLNHNIHYTIAPIKKKKS